MKLVLDQSQGVAAWVAARIPHMFGAPFPPEAVGIGVVTTAGIPVGGVVFSDYLPAVGNIQVSFAADSPKWLTKSLISGIMAYPFTQLRVQRCTAIVPPSATNATQFLERMGWKREGVIRLGFGDQDAIVWGLLATEWKWCRYNLARPVDKPKRRRRRRRTGTLSLPQGAPLH